MRLAISLKWLLLRAQTFRPHFKFFQSNPAKLLKHCSNQTETYHDFTNKNRPQNQAVVDLKASLPLEIKLSTQIHETNGRIYCGENAAVTTILKATRPKHEMYALLNWKRGLTKELGEDGYNDIVTKIRNRGTTFHQAIKQYLLTSTQPELHKSNIGHWESVQHVVSNIDQVIALESAVLHPQLQYAGTLDGIIVYQGKVCIIDWKTSEKRRQELKHCFSYPHQIVAYAGAVNYDSKYDPIQINHGLLVLAYPDGSPAETIWMTPDTCKYYWQEWLHRLEAYKRTIASTNTLYNPIQGRSMLDLAKFINGVQSKSTEDSSVTENGSANFTSDSVVADECTDSIVDVFENDPTTAEFDEKY